MKINKKPITLFFGFLVAFTTAIAQPTPPEGQNWVEVPELTDEFNGNFDNTKWFKSTWNYDAPVFMQNDNSGVADGHLWIKATDDTSKANDERWFQTSRVHSRAKIKFPMYTECKMITAHISAYNTFWLNNGDINNRDEIDIVENNSKPSCCQTDFPWQMNSQYFIAKNGVTERNKGNFDNRNLSASNPKKGVKWNEDYHIVGAWWKDKNNVQFYLDGEPAGSVSSTQDFTLEQELIWDLWTADEPWLGGIANRSDLQDDSINTMRVDWVHTYKLEGTAPDRNISLVWDNKADFVLSGESRPVFEPGETISINATYTTSRTGGVEEDLTYVAMHLRELDENGSPVSTSQFVTTIPGSAPNNDTTSYNYTIPATFPSGANIPTIENIDPDHKIILLFYLLEGGNGGSLANQNTEIVLTNDRNAYETTLSSASVADISKTPRVYPNPFDSELAISDINFESWELFDLNGNSIKKGTSNIIEGNALTKGIYILILDKKTVLKIIKE